jgi:Ca2+-binding RTX toxin-like protein
LDDPYTFIADSNFDIVFGDDAAFDVGAPGNDTINGGTGVNFSCYCGATSGVTVDLQAGTATGGGGNDTLSSLQGIIGSPFDDTLRGSAANEGFELSPGTDSIDGRGGEDIIESFDNTGLTADLAAGTGSGEVPAFVNGQFDAFPSTLALANIEDIWASFNGPDSLGGSSAANRFYSFGGNDTLTGQQQNDFLDAGLGTDSADGGAGTDTCIDAETATACESTGPAVARKTGFAPKAFTLHHLRWAWGTRF